MIGSTTRKKGCRKGHRLISPITGGDGPKSTGKNKDLMAGAPPSSAAFEQTKMQLAELIDEVVFSEQEKSRLDKECDRLRGIVEPLEAALQNMLAYTASMEAAVLLPAIKNLAAAVPDDSLSMRAQAMNMLDALHDLTPRTAKLIMSLKSPSAAMMQKFHKRREEILVSHHQGTEAVVSLEDAYVLVALLLETKDELQILVGDTVNRMTHIRSGVSPSSHNHAELGPLRRQLESAAESLNRERDETKRLKEMLAAVQTDREALMGKLQQVAPFQSLQEQYHQERDLLHSKLRTLEQDLRRVSDELIASNQALDATRKALEQSYREKGLLDDELSQLRRFGGHSVGLRNSEFGTASRDATTLKQQQHPTRFWEELALRLQRDVDEQSKQHSSLVTRLEAENSQLRLELAESKSSLNRESEVQREQISRLRHANDEMHRELAQLQQRFLAPTMVGVNTSRGSPSRSHATGGHSAASPSAALMDHRIRAFEDTIQALQGELGSVEMKLTHVEAHYTQERQLLVKQFDEERQRYQREREECDMLVLRMSAEMELLVKENDSLRSLVNNHPV